MGFPLKNLMNMPITPLASLQSLREKRRLLQENAVSNPVFEESLQQFQKSVHEFCDLWQSRIDAVFVESPLLETVIEAADEKLAGLHLEALLPFLRMEHFDEGNFPERPSILTDRIGPYQSEVPIFLSKNKALGQYLTRVGFGDLAKQGWHLDALTDPSERAQIAKATVDEWHRLATDTLGQFRQSMDQQIEQALPMKDWWNAREDRGLDQEQRKLVSKSIPGPVISQEFALAHAISRNLVEDPAPRSTSSSWRP